MATIDGIGYRGITINEQSSKEAIGYRGIVQFQATVTGGTVTSEPWHRIEQGMVTTQGAGMGGVLIE